jgi:hypothetical protein
MSLAEHMHQHTDHLVSPINGSDVLSRWLITHRGRSATMGKKRRDGADVPDIFVGEPVVVQRFKILVAQRVERASAPAR